MTIAYDNVEYSDKPEKWDMGMLLGVATALGLMGVLETFGILYVGLEQFKLSRETLQSFIYLKLSVAGHLLMFMARTRGPFWSVRPATPLLIAVIATQLIATLITVYGVMLPAMGWGLALFVWAYCAVVLFVIDFLKVRLYDLLNREVRFKR
jgi:H+-transporting ATPase